jgi:hypothetical protein
LLYGFSVEIDRVHDRHFISQYSAAFDRRKTLGDIGLGAKRNPALVNPRSIDVIGMGNQYFPGRCGHRTVVQIVIAVDRLLAVRQQDVGRKGFDFIRTTA